MARKKTGGGAKKPAVVDPAAMGLRAEVLEQPITETLETNYMPYAMSVIVSRAIPEIDGFKPSQRQCGGPDHEAQPPRRRGHL